MLTKTLGLNAKQGALEMAQLVEVLGAVSRERSTRQTRFYQPELDGLRFYAFLAVFACHTLPYDDSFYRTLHLPLPRLWTSVARSGGAGVDLFFALSAYLITSLLLRERRETRTISIGSFYVRRILRIWPLYFAVLALGVVLAHVTSAYGYQWYYQQKMPWYYCVGYVLFAGNWVYAFFGPAVSICSPLWTISIEEQFYLVWPPLMKRLERRGMVIASIIGCLSALTMQACIALFRVRSGFVYFGSASVSLPLGVLLALFADRLPRLRTVGRRLLVSVGLCTWVVSAWLVDQPGDIGMTLVSSRLLDALAAGALLYACLHSPSKLLTGEWVVRLGKMSYGLYMLHFFGLLIALTVFQPRHGWALLAGKEMGLVVTVSLAAASYRWIESPFLRLKDRFATVLSRPV